jgi:YHS domain-containing protein
MAFSFEEIGKMKTCLILFFCLSAWGVYAQSETFRAKQYNLESGLAIKGYDPVSYFTQGRAEKGKKEHSVSDRGVIYYFTSGTDKDLFLSNPAKYEPQYGGWCAYAMGHDGSKVEVDPETFKITDGKLFLFYHQIFNNTLKTWNQDETRLHTQADAHWQKIIQENQKTPI